MNYCRDWAGEKDDWYAQSKVFSNWPTIMPNEVHHDGRIMNTTIPNHLSGLFHIADGDSNRTVLSSVSSAEHDEYDQDNHNTHGQRTAHCDRNRIVRDLIFIA